MDTVSINCVELLLLLLTVSIASAVCAGRGRVNASSREQAMAVWTRARGTDGIRRIPKTTHDRTDARPPPPSSLRRVRTGNQYRGPSSAERPISRTYVLQPIRDSTETFGGKGIWSVGRAATTAKRYTFSTTHNDASGVRGQTTRAASRRANNNKKRK